MMRQLVQWAIMLSALATVVGCYGSADTPDVRSYEIKMPSGLERAKLLLQQYVDGGQIGSEATTYGEIVEEVRKTDPAKATILEDGFAELQKNPGRPGPKAKEILEKLQ